jgi:mannose-6-phosphate isomerase-like protein (cupin superfamily)
VTLSLPEVKVLLDALGDACRGVTVVEKPWGVMRELEFNSLLVKVIEVRAGCRTSLQYHREKDELIIPLEGDGFVEVGDPAGIYELHDGPLRIRPLVAHRVTGPLRYIEFETNDHGEDTVRLVDDYGRTT